MIRACVGEVTHPMTEEHHIAFIWLATDKAVHRAVLDHTGALEAVFRLAEGEKAEAVYEFCNLHGLRRLLPERALSPRPPRIHL